METGLEGVHSPMRRLEHVMHSPVAFVIIPLFALVNSGIPLLAIDLRAVASDAITTAVLIGLVVGKPLGIVGFAPLALRLKWCELPKAVNMHHIIGVGLIGGIGFAMSIFIGELAFTSHGQVVLNAKTGILFASIAAGLMGFVWIRCFCPRAQAS